MSLMAETIRSSPGAYRGLRLTAEEYFALPDDGVRYELIDGVVIMSPSPSTRHQRICAVLFNQIFSFVEPRRLGLVLYETDAHIGSRSTGRDLVYRPEIVFIRSERVAQVTDRIRIVPDLVVEVISPDSRNLDAKTKRDDYERAGVGEYWLIDPELNAMTFFRLVDDRFATVEVKGDSFESLVIPDFRLDLARVRDAFHAFQ